MTSFAEEEKAIKALVERARYRQAFLRARKLYLGHKDRLEAQYLYAVLLGDSDQGERSRKACVGLLRPLLRRLRLFTPLTRYRVRNEYYWFSRQHRKQYRLGLEAARRGVPRAPYFQGVGAAWHALGLAQKGRRSPARRWATLSVWAWRRFLRTERYYNAHVHLALALGILGKAAEMERSLRRAARLAGRPADYPEFQEIRALVKGLRA